MAGFSKRRMSLPGRVAKKARPMPSRNPYPVPFLRLCLTQRIQLLSFSSPPTLGQIWQQFRPSLSNITAARLAELTGLFDLYKINSFNLTFLPRFQTFDAGSSTVNPVPTFTFNTDNLNVLNAPGGGVYDNTTYNTFLERSQQPTHVLADKIIKCRSKKAMTLDTDSQVKPFPWTTSTNTTRQAYGIDMFIHTPNFANFPGTTEFDVIIEMDVSFKGNR